MRPFSFKPILNTFALSLALMGSAQAAIVESFDAGSWSANWIGGSAAGTINAAAAHDGAFGVTLGGANWTYNTTLTIAEGDVLSAWIRPNANSNGRVYLGFGADATGTHSFVGGSNTGQLLFQDNPSYNFQNLAVSSESWVRGQWYLMQVEWLAGGNATGKLFAADGVTLVDTLNVAGLSRASGGLALRGFGGWDLDTVSISPSQPVPEPQGLALIGLGLTALALSRRRRAR